MTFEIYHQLGYRPIWNLQSIRDDETGQGVIISPRFLGLSDIGKLPVELREKSIFDPQFFRPNTALGKLSEYDFFPDRIAAGFSTSEYADSYAFESANRCVDFQLLNNFRYVVIPTRHAPGMPTNLIQNQQDLFVTPFLSAIAQRDDSKPVILQLLLNANMLKDSEYAADLLNWVTGIDMLAGVYMIVEVSPRGKQIADADLLFSMLMFVDALVQNKLDVVIGYLNTEALPLSIASPRIMTVGIYENTRMFDIRNFERTESSQQQGPAARIYISKLLQWVSYQYVGAMQRALEYEAGFFDQNQYQALMFEPSYRWHFSKPELYKHALLVFERQLRNIASLEGRNRYEFVRDTIQTALTYYARMEAGGVVFDRDSGGDHLASWLTAVNQFGIAKGWS